MVEERLERVQQVRVASAGKAVSGERVVVIDDKELAETKAGAASSKLRPRATWP